MEQYNYYLYSPAAHYGSQPDFYCVNSLPTEGFSSLYAVTNETASAIQQTGTTRSFKGVVYSPYVWLDFDTAEAAERAGSRLEELGLGFKAYDTGNRGNHFRLDRDTSNGPSHLLPAQDKAWVAAVFPEADRSIYTHLHPFRMEGTYHEKTGRVKTLVFERAGSALKLPPYEEQTFAYNTSTADSGGRKSIFDNLQLMANTVPVFNGERQYFLVRQLYALKSCGMSADFALTWIQEWNKMLQEPKDDAELEKALRSIYR